MIPRVKFGDVDPATTDWRDAPDDDPDDEQMDETPPDVVGMLGFDPADEPGAHEYPGSGYQEAREASDGQDA